MNAESVFTILMGLASFVKLIKELMLICQQEFPAGSGEAKKSTVLEGLATIVEDNAVWEKIKGLFGIIIDCIAIFKKKE